MHPFCGGACCGGRRSSLEKLRTATRSDCHQVPRLTAGIRGIPTSKIAPPFAQSCAETGSARPPPSSGMNYAALPSHVGPGPRRYEKRTQLEHVSNRPGGRMEHLSGQTPPSSSTRQAIDRRFRHRCASQSRLHRSEGGHERAGAESRSRARGHQRSHISTALLFLAVQRPWDCSLQRRPKPHGKQMAVRCEVWSQHLLD